MRNIFRSPSENDCHSTEEEFPSTCEQIELDEAIAPTLDNELNSFNSKEVIDVPLSLERQAAMTPNGNYALKQLQRCSSRVGIPSKT